MQFLIPSYPFPVVVGIFEADKTGLGDSQESVSAFENDGLDV